MKVRIVKCNVITHWYHDQIGSIVNVFEKGYPSSNMYYMGDSHGILKEDCEIIEADEPKLEPFDLERALKGDKVILSGIKDEVTDLYHAKSINKIIGLVRGMPYAWDINGVFYDHNGNRSWISDLKMAPREPEYQTVWVNMLNECPPGAKEGYFTHHATLSKEESLSILEPNDKVIGTFPITFKKP